MGEAFLVQKEGLPSLFREALPADPQSPSASPQQASCRWLRETGTAAHTWFAVPERIQATPDCFVTGLSLGTTVGQERPSARLLRWGITVGSPQQSLSGRHPGKSLSPVAPLTPRRDSVAR